MKPETIKTVNDPSEVPTNLSGEEEIKFWETHGVTEEFLEKVEPVPENELPRFRLRSKPINVRFDDVTLSRLKALAKRRNLGYQTLLKEFVIERLYEEEKREGLLLAGEAEKAQALSESSRKQGAVERREWTAEVQRSIGEHEELLEAEDLDQVVSSRILKRSTSLLLEISGEIKASSSKEDYPLKELQETIRAYKKLKQFCDKAIKIHSDKFGNLEPKVRDRQEEAESNVVLSAQEPHNS